MIYALYQDNEIIEEGTKKEMEILLKGIFNESPELMEFIEEYEIKPKKLEKTQIINVSFIEKDSVVLCIVDGKSIGYITESVRNGVGFGYSFDKPTQCETMVFYSNNGFRNLSETKEKFIKVINKQCNKKEKKVLN